MDVEPSPTSLKLIASGIFALFVVGALFFIIFIFVGTFIGRILLSLVVSLVVSVPIIGAIEDFLLYPKRAERTSYTNSYESDK